MNITLTRRKYGWAAINNKEDYFNPLNYKGCYHKCSRLCHPKCNTMHTCAGYETCSLEKFQKEASDFNTKNRVFNRPLRFEEKADNEKLFSCKHCPKSFATHLQCESHLQTHVIKNPFECEHCLKRFIQKDKLKIHMKIHEEEKNVPSEGTSFSVRFYMHAVSQNKTVGQFDPNRSLLFHIQHDKKQYVHFIEAFGGNSLSLECVEEGCNARVGVRLSKKLKTIKTKSDLWRPKYHFAETNEKENYFNPISYNGCYHKCTKLCLPKCTTLHSCEGYDNCSETDVLDWPNLAEVDHEINMDASLDEEPRKPMVEN